MGNRNKNLKNDCDMDYYQIPLFELLKLMPELLDRLPYCIDTSDMDYLARFACIGDKIQYLEIGYGSGDWFIRGVV